MYRESAYPGPNALDSSSYTNLNGDPQGALKQQQADQTIVADINAAGSQDAVDSLNSVRESSRAESQSQYDSNRFLATFMADRLEANGGGGNLAALAYELAGTPSFDVNVPYIPGKNLEGVPNADTMRERIKRKYLKNPGGQILPQIPRA